MPSQPYYDAINRGNANAQPGVPANPSGDRGLTPGLSRADRATGPDPLAITNSYDEAPAIGTRGPGGMSGGMLGSMNAVGSELNSGDGSGGVTDYTSTGQEFTGYGGGGSPGGQLSGQLGSIRDFWQQRMQQMGGYGGGGYGGAIGGNPNPFNPYGGGGGMPRNPYGGGGMYGGGMYGGGGFGGGGYGGGYGGGQQFNPFQGPGGMRGLAQLGGNVRALQNGYGGQMSPYGGQFGGYGGGYGGQMGGYSPFYGGQMGGQQQQQAPYQRPPQMSPYGGGGSQFYGMM